MPELKTLDDFAEMRARANSLSVKRARRFRVLFELDTTLPAWEYLLLSLKSGDSQLLLGEKAFRFFTLIVNLGLAGTDRDIVEHIDAHQLN